MSFLLDTNMISQLTKDEPNVAAMNWFARTDQDLCFLSVVTLLEIGAGIVTMPVGRRRSNLAFWLHERLPKDFPDRILELDGAIALDAGDLLGRQKQAGWNAEVKDVLIASTARVRGLGMVTLNRKHFERLEVRLVDL